MLQRMGEHVHRLWHNVRKAVDIRFSSESDEKNFVKSWQGTLLKSTVVASVLFAGGVAQHSVPRYIQETSRTDGRHFAWDGGDVRTEYFIFMISCTSAILLLAILAGIQLLTDRWWSLPWDKIVTFDLCLAVFEIDYATRLMLDSTWLPTETRPTTELQSLLIIDCIITASCLFLPVRCCILWIVPGVAIFGYAAFVLLAVGIEPSLLLSYFVLFCLFLFALAGAFRNEIHSRAKFIAQKDIVELSTWAKGMQTVAETLCDVVLEVTPDLVIVGTGAREASLFGRSVQGRLFTDLLIDTDRSRFTAALGTSQTGLPICLPVTLKNDEVCHHGSECSLIEAQLLLVNTNGQSPRYLIGMQVDRSERPAAPPVQDMGQDILLAGRASAPREDLEPAGSEAGHVAPSISFTEHVFQGASVSQIVDIGIREHWLINEDAIDYEQSGIIGRGGFGEVVVAHFFGARVAVKTHHRPEHKETEALKTALLELRMLRHLRHPHIIEFLGATLSTDSGSPRLRLVFEYMRGGFNADIIVRHLGYKAGLSRGAQLLLSTILRDVCSALLYMHSLEPPMIHRDIKGSNVLIELLDDGEVRAKVCDFGLSHHTGILKEGGTVRYMAPEVIQGLRASTAVDVFAFGRLLFLLATGTKPLLDMEVPNLIRAARDGRVPSLEWPDEVALPGCRQLAEACTQFVAEKRPGIRDIMLEIRRWNKAEAVLSSKADDQIPGAAQVEELGRVSL
eukprot:TRINITY_DN19226_c0_g2_i1.p1 TRINITY_DN19226_c0_g2~~TRINITY_DN19226_c0_g2_i1.p1  ORF type:complete len:734 (-),score=79.13 TRINITY_DN19226_c0_g2_i1:201-2402(-)